MKLQVYPSEQLAKELEALRLIRAGVIDMTISASSLTNFAEIMTFSDMPFLLRDTVAMQKLINSAIGKRIEREMIEKIGIRPMGYFQRGERHLTSNRPIKHPDDLDELIIRVPNAPPMWWLGKRLVLNQPQWLFPKYFPLYNKAP